MSIGYKRSIQSSQTHTPMAGKMKMKQNLLSSSDPHPYILFWHSFWHTIWIHLGVFMAYIYSDILSDILSGIYSDILYDILSGIRSDIYSDILYDILSGIRSDIYSDILSGILSGTWARNIAVAGTLHSLLISWYCSLVQAHSTASWSCDMALRSRYTPQHPQLARKKRRGRTRERRRGRSCTFVKI